jgi:hypothetical protein
MLKLNTVNSDGSTNDRAEIPVEIFNPETGNVIATIWVTGATQAEWRQIQKTHTKPERNPTTRQMERVTDHTAAAVELLKRHILRWNGVIGADDKPLPVLPVVIERLDPRTQTQCFEAIIGAEYKDDDLPEVREESFQKPA